MWMYNSYMVWVALAIAHTGKYEDIASILNVKNAFYDIMRLKYMLCMSKKCVESRKVEKVHQDTKNVN